MRGYTIPKRGPLSNPAAKPDDSQSDDIAAKFDEGTEIDDAMREAVRDALLFHKRMGNPIASWVDGKVVWIAPEDIPV